MHHNIVLGKLEIHFFQKVQCRVQTQVLKLIKFLSRLKSSFMQELILGPFNKT